jgi:vacuolar-type H+-ATPase subunit E/Vma4
MKAKLPTGSAAALGPVRAALQADARADADTVLGEARRRADEIRTTAHRRAADILHESRADGERQANVAVAAALTRQRRAARTAMLAAQRELYEELRRRCAEAARAMRDDPDYPELRRQLTEYAATALGPEAAIHESDDGGIVVSNGRRRVDLSLPTLVERELDGLGGEVQRLWAA